MKCLGNSLIVVQGRKVTERKGILLPDSVQEDSPLGEVIAIGPGVQQIDVGDHVLIPSDAYFRIMRSGKFDMEVDGKPALVLKEDQIQVVWPKEELN